MSLWRVPVTWTGNATVGGGLSIFNFNTAGGTAAQAVTAVVNFLTATDDRRIVGCNWSCGEDVDELDHVTGALLSTTSFTPALGFGVAAGDPLPPAVQGLLRLTTGSIVGGRVLRGRLFLPGAEETQNINGAPLGAYMTDYNAAAAVLLAVATADWVVWSRTHGAMASVLSAACWTKWAQLRSRRD